MTRPHQIQRYQNFLQHTRGLQFADYDALWRWSVTELDAFWLSLWDFFGLTSATPFERALCEDRMPGAVWFRHAQSRRTGTAARPGGCCRAPPGAGVQQRGHARAWRAR